MAASTDEIFEILMAYADGELDPEASAQVEALLRTDAEARAWVSMFRATGRVIAAPYEGIMHEPVPAHLIQFVMSYGTERQESLGPERPEPAAFLPSRRARLTGLWADWRDRLIPAGAAWHLAAASVAALIFGAGFLLRGDGGSGPNLATLRPGQAVTSGVLYHVLESLPSEERAAGSTLRAVLTFRTKEGGYCREYAAEGQFQGLACRQAGGGWVIDAHLAQETGASGTHIVGHSEALDKIAESRMAGDALGKSEEEAVIKSSWK